MPDLAKIKLAELGLILPDATPPDLPFAPFALQDGLLIVSGQIPEKDGEIVFRGRVGEDVDLPTARQAARLCTLHVVAQIDAACGGDLGRVSRVVRVGGYIACTPDFTQQSQVINAASELLRDVFGERGHHARTAIGVASLPLGVSVEVDAIVALRDAS